MRHGFYPAGGGEVRATVRPVAALRTLDLTERGDLVSTKATAVVAGLPADIARRELDLLAGIFGQVEQEMRVLNFREGPGNVVMIEITHTQHTEVFTGFGEKGLKAETVANRTAHDARRWLASGATVGEHLADQLLLPMALAGGGSFTVATLSSHTQTNIGVIEKFLPVEFEVTACGTAHSISVGKA